MSHTSAWGINSKSMSHSHPSRVADARLMPVFTQNDSDPVTDFTKRAFRSVCYITHRYHQIYCHAF